MTPRTSHGFRILNCKIRVDGPEAIVAPIAFAYRRFAVPPEELRDAVTLSVTDGQVSVDGVVLPALAADPRVRQLYQEFVQLAMDRIDGYAIVHAACLVNRKDEACLLAAPSGHGKSSLSLALAAMDYRLAGDDYAPLDLATGEVQPFPRSIAIYPEGTAQLPDVVTRETRKNGPMLFGKRLLDIGELFGENSLVKSPVRLRTLLLLNDQVAASKPISIDVGFHGTDPAGFEKELRAIDGVEIVNRTVQGAAGQWTLRLDHTHYPTSKLNALLDRPEARCQKRLTARPGFEGQPQLTPVPRRVAADTLCKELLNRRGSGALMKGYQGSLARLFLDLAGALRDVRCYRLELGDFSHTVDTIRGLLDD